MPRFRGLEDSIRFLWRFLRHPRSIGAVAPSSHWLARRMADDMNLETAKTVVEFGPGTGSFTGEIAGRIQSDALFLALELDPQLAALAAERCARAEVINDSAAHLPVHLKHRDRSNVDAILCGLPWASLPIHVQDSVLSAAVDSLRPGGRFATFAYIHAAWFPAARRFHRTLRERFRRVEKTPVVWRNLPPAFVYRCEK